MKIMTGIDLHSHNALCGLMDESGRRVLHKKLPCELPAILQVLAPYKSQITQVAVESTYNWYWLVDGLEDHGYPVVLANPARMKPYDGLKHTDDVSDAYFLCELMRLGILPTSHRYDRQTRPVRDLLRRRMLLVQLRTSLILSFKSLNERTLGQRVPVVAMVGGQDAQAHEFAQEVGVGHVVGMLEAVVLFHARRVGQHHGVALVFEAIDQPIPVVGGLDGHLGDL